MYDLLMSPGQIGTLQLPNRVIMGSMHLAFENQPAAGDRLALFYAERARGEAGLIVTGGSAITPDGASDMQFTHIWKPEEKEKFQTITSEVHKAGGKIALQLFHAGRYAREDKTGLKPVAPSAVPTKMSPTLAKELTDEEIWEIIKAFGRGAALAREYGFDAVEIMGSEGYLINQFTSPVTNLRVDDWGGSWEKRIRFPVEVVKSVRKHAGEDFPVIFRMSGLDLIPGSTTMDETIMMAKTLEEYYVSALNIGIGWHESLVPTVQSSVPQGSFAHISALIKRAVSIPVITSNRINQPEHANRLIAEGVADFVSLARPFLADPHFVRKVREKRVHAINTCIGCNQSCLDKIFSDLPASCLVNPEAGREGILPLHPTSQPLNVAVVGGGPAGMEAARVLAERRHIVSLYEKEHRLGGQFRLAAQVPGKEDYAETIRYYEHELERLQVKIRLNTAPDPKELNSYDAVILATGVHPRKLSIPGIDLPYVYDYTDYLEDRIIAGEKVAVIGAGGIAVDIAHRLTESIIRPEVALFFIEQQVDDPLAMIKQMRPRRKVHLMRRGRRVAAHIGKSTRWVALQKLDRHQVEIHTGIEYDSITQEGVWIIRDGQKEMIPADTVIVAAGQLPNQELLNELIESGFTHCSTPPVNGYYEGAVHDGILPFVQRKQHHDEKFLFQIGGARMADELDAERAILEGALVGRLLS